jgi:hypothetical protein
MLGSKETVADRSQTLSSFNGCVLYGRQSDKWQLTEIHDPCIMRERCKQTERTMWICVLVGSEIF